MIFKFPLNKHGETPIYVSIRELLSAQMQGDQLVVWVDTATAEARMWTFHAVYTGEPSPAHSVYISTVQDGSLVYHVYAS